MKTESAHDAQADETRFFLLGQDFERHTESVREAVVHGALHLTGMDHETDHGEMLALQAELMRWVS